MTKEKTILFELNKIKLSDGQKASASELSVFARIQEQRHSQRKYMFWLAYYSVVLLLLLMFLPFILCFRKSFRDFVKWQSFLLPIYYTVVPCGVYGIIRIITSSLWSDEIYKDMIREEDLRKNKRRNVGEIR
jgi:hypothetical protein